MDSVLDDSIPSLPEKKTVAHLLLKNLEAVPCSLTFPLIARPQETAFSNVSRWKNFLNGREAVSSKGSPMLYFHSSPVSFRSACLIYTIYTYKSRISSDHPSKSKLCTAHRAVLYGKSYCEGNGIYCQDTKQAQ